jgi:hypothetical protein
MSAVVVMNIFIWKVMCGLRCNKTVEYNPRGEKSQKNKHIGRRVVRYSVLHDWVLLHTARAVAYHVISRIPCTYVVVDNEFGYSFFSRRSKDSQRLLSPLFLHCRSRRRMAQKWLA